MRDKKIRLACRTGLSVVRTQLPIGFTDREAMMWDGCCVTREQRHHVQPHGSRSAGLSLPVVLVDRARTVPVYFAGSARKPESGRGRPRCLLRSAGSSGAIAAGA
ncbi:hypothetical protein DMH04_53395 [Kibdelosporangium aridum]|uniref:Uncharacterized protein n=1 Tax=Kibdelosporangium aridum TaxID=2030 RepID=A0A428Y332_KIBAR|nr:hypothetical protein DMH04_53395 [Kibdelosporangium aridum]